MARLLARLVAMFFDRRVAFFGAEEAVEFAVVIGWLGDVCSFSGGGSLTVDPTAIHVRRLDQLEPDEVVTVLAAPHGLDEMKYTVLPDGRKLVVCRRRRLPPDIVGDDGECDEQCFYERNSGRPCRHPRELDGAWVSSYEAWR